MFKLRSLMVPALALSLTFVASCGGGGANMKMLDEAQEKITALEAKGVPPTELSMAKVHLSNARDNLDKRNNAQAKKNVADMKAELEKAQKFYDEQITTLPPKVNAAKSNLAAAKAELSGFQARKVDSTVAVIDSLMRVDRPMQANNLAQEWVAHIPTLKDDERKSATLRRTVPGTWVFEDKYVSVEVSPRDAAVTRKEFTFGRDGRATIVESKKGQSGPYFKEDWLFRSWGTYDFKGDTIMLMISRFKAERQMFERYHVADKKWVKEPGPTYDSAITDGSQDRFITIADLRLDFKKR